MKDFYCYSNRGFLKMGNEEICFYIPIDVMEKSYWVHVNDEICIFDSRNYRIICCISGEKIFIYKSEDNRSIISILKKGTYYILKNDRTDIVISKINNLIE
jgi:hypothetical protein